MLSFDFYQSAEDFTARYPILVKVGSADGATFAGDQLLMKLMYKQQNRAGWQTLTFDFSNAAPSYPNNQNPAEDISGTYTTVDLFIDPGSPTESLTAVDNIGGGTQGAAIVGQIQILGQVDQHLHQMHQEKVVSLFSDHYTQGFQILLIMDGVKEQS